jgi:hypothetical protein
MSYAPRVGDVIEITVAQKPQRIVSMRVLACGEVVEERRAVHIDGVVYLREGVDPFVCALNLIAFFFMVDLDATGEPNTSEDRMSWRVTKVHPLETFGPYPA